MLSRNATKSIENGTILSREKAADIIYHIYVNFWLPCYAVTASYGFFCGEQTLTYHSYPSSPVMFSNEIVVRRGFSISNIICTSSKTKLLTRVSLSRYKSTTSKLPDEFSEADHLEARHWLDEFNINTIPRSLGDVSFSRSSGPGGQNVNKCATNYHS